MSNVVDFIVSFKTKTVHFEHWDVNSTVGQVKQHIFQETSMPAETQKLLWKGRVLREDHASLESLSINNGSKLLLMGSLPMQIERVTEMDEKVEEQRKVAATIRSKKHQIYRGSAATKTTSSSSSNYTFHKLTVIDEFPHPDKARNLLERLRDDRGVRAIMAARKWSVGELTELTPFESSILGYNRNKGQLIAVRLRTDDLSGFRYYDSIRKVLLHELTHNVHSEHDDKFHALNRQLNKDVVALDWTAHRGHSLGNGDYYNPESDEGSDVIDQTYEAGAYKLGAGTNPTTRLEQLSTPDARRARLAAAAMARLTKKEEQELDEGCGSAS